jgi:cell division protein FtsL
MNKSSIFKVVLIVIVIIVILLITTLFYRIYQVKNFQKDLRPTTETEKQEIIEILNQNMNITGYEIIFGKVFTRGNEVLIQVQLKKGVLTKSYLINLENKSLVRNQNEK